MKSADHRQTWVSAICFGVMLLAANRAPSTEPDDQKPFHKLREHRSDFAGSDGDTADAVEVRGVRIGYFGPGDAQDRIAGDMWRAAQAAVSDANRQGGFHGKPFCLVPVWSQDPWGTGVALLTRAVYQDKVWAIVGGIDGPSTHLAEQVVAKARVPLISPVSTDKTANLANVPWLFSLAPGDHLIAPVLAAEIDRCAGQHDWVLISSDDHDSHLLTGEVKKALTRRQRSPQFHFVYRQSAPELAPLIERTIDADPAVVVILADTDDSALFVRHLRSSGYGGVLFGGPGMGRRRFNELAGDAADGVVFPLLSDAVRDPLSGEQLASSSTAAEATEDAQSPPDDRTEWDDAAAQTYDAVRLTVDAIRRGGLNRARIREAIRELAPWSGLTGTVRWDALGANTRPACLATIANGRTVGWAKANRQLEP